MNWADWSGECFDIFMNIFHFHSDFDIFSVSHIVSLSAFRADSPSTKTEDWRILFIVVKEKFSYSMASHEIVEGEIELAKCLQAMRGEEAFKRNIFSAIWTRMRIYMKMFFYSYSKAQSLEEGISLSLLMNLFSGLSRHTRACKNLCRRRWKSLSGR